MNSPLIRKQLSELKYMYFSDKTTGLPLKGKGLFKKILLTIFIFVCLGLSYFAIAQQMYDILIPLNGDFLYFGTLISMVIIVTTFIMMFSASSTIYKNKDNELLLSLPLKIEHITLSRFINIILPSYFYVLSFCLPIFIIYLINKFDLLILILGMFVTVIVSILVSGLSIILGMIVAIISNRFKSNTYVTVVLSLGLIAFYYYINSYINSNLLQLALSYTKSVSIPFYLYIPVIIGKAINKDLFSLLILMLISFFVIFVAYKLVCTKFMDIACSTSNVKKKTYNNKVNKQNSIRWALIKRELKLFTSNATYMINTGLGIVLFMAYIVSSLIFKDKIFELKQSVISFFMGYDFIPLLVVGIMTTTFGMDAYATPSVSLEGNNYWISRSIPISTYDLLKAKSNTQLVLNFVPYVLTTIVFSFMLNFEDNLLVMVTILSIIQAFFIADIDLVFGIIGARLHWTSEIVPIKQNTNVLFAVLIATAIGVLPTIIYLKIYSIIDLVSYIQILIVIFALGYKLIENWIKTKGTKIYENLN